MTALAAARETAKQDAVLSFGQLMASTKIYKGATVFKKMSGANAGYVFSPDGSVNTLAVGDLFLGIAYETVDNTSGANGALQIRVEKSGAFKLPFSDTLSQGKEGSPVYVNATSADSVVTITSADAGNAQAVVGVIDQYADTGSAWVRIDNYVDQLVGSAGPVNVDPTASAPSAVKVYKFTYDFAVQGGAIGTVGLTGAKLPANAIIIDGMVDVVTPLTSGGAGTAAVQVENANDTVNAAAVSGAPWSTTGRKDVVESGTAANSVKVSTAKVPSIVIATAALTAGKFNVYLRVVNG